METILEETIPEESLAQRIVSKVNASLFRMKSEPFIMQRFKTIFSLIMFAMRGILIFPKNLKTNSNFKK